MIETFDHRWKRAQESVTVRQASVALLELVSSGNPEYHLDISIATHCMRTAASACVLVHAAKVDVSFEPLIAAGLLHDAGKAECPWLYKSGVVLLGGDRSQLEGHAEASLRFSSKVYPSGTRTTEQRLTQGIIIDNHRKFREHGKRYPTDERRQELAQLGHIDVADMEDILHDASTLFSWGDAADAITHPSETRSYLEGRLSAEGVYQPSYLAARNIITTDLLPAKTLSPTDAVLEIRTAREFIEGYADLNLLIAA